jgi:light-regulated signal transduction histidine kinase (bacteriophytochrome)
VNFTTFFTDVNTPFVREWAEGKNIRILNEVANLLMKIQLKLQIRRLAWCGSTQADWNRMEVEKLEFSMSSLDAFINRQVANAGIYFEDAESDKEAEKLEAEHMLKIIMSEIYQF